MNREQDEMNRRGIGMTSQRTRERLIQRLYEEGLSNAQVLEVIRRTPRHMFVDEAFSHRAYEDTSLPIGHNQTISQPYMVARMSELLLEAGPLDKVLEIGTGSGYQTAVLAQLVERVFSVERIQGLQDRAKERLVELNLRNVVFRWGTVGKVGQHWHLITELLSQLQLQRCRRLFWTSLRWVGDWLSRLAPAMCSN